MIRVVVVEDHPVTRLGLKLALQSADGIELVGEGASLADAHVLMAMKPDVVLLDLVLPDGRGVDAMQSLRSAHEAARIVFLTGMGTAADARDALRCGASGYLTKDGAIETLADAVKDVMRGAIVVAPSVRAELNEGFRKTSLSKRELEVLELVIEGCTNPEIGRALQLSTGTIRTHVSHILEKLDVASRTEAAAFAIRNRLT